MALRVLPTAVRCREVGAGRVTYRKSLTRLVPGLRLVVAVRCRWSFRRTEMLGGGLLGAGLSLRALDRTGLARPRLDASGRTLRSPGEEDERLAAGLSELYRDDWLSARALLLDVLEDHPGCLPAHAALGDLHAVLRHDDLAMAHHGAAVRLGWPALHGGAAPPTGSSARWLLSSLVARARLFAARGATGPALADCRRALRLDPEDELAAALGAHLTGGGPAPGRVARQGRGGRLAGG